jgi:hypothetical protein
MLEHAPLRAPHVNSLAVLLQVGLQLLIKPSLMQYRSRLLETIAFEARRDLVSGRWVAVFR